MSLFKKSRFKRYSEIVEFDNPESALGSAKELMKEFNEAKTKAKKLRVARACQYSENRAFAMSKRKNLSKEEKEQFLEISNIYGKKADIMWREYRKLE